MSEMKKNDGGPAFPPNDFHAPSGMSLRDWFAGQALTGLIANPENSGSAAQVVELSYGIADAMLAERSK